MSVRIYSGPWALLAILTAALWALAPGAPAQGAHPGAIDHRFGDEGEVTISVQGASFDPAALAVRSDGMTYVVGALAIEGRQPAAELVVARLLADGVPDARFGVAGVVRTALPRGLTVEDVALEPGGGLVVVGSVTAQEGDTDDAGAVLRLLADGSLDRGFGSDGMAVVDVPGTGAGFTTVSLQPDGSILAAGNDGYYYHGQQQGTLVRLTPAGRLDATFMEDGLAAPAATSIDALVPTGATVQALGPDTPYDWQDEREPIRIVGVGIAPGPVPSSPGSTLYASRRWGSIGSLDATPLDGGDVLAAAGVRSRDGRTGVLTVRVDKESKLRRATVHADVADGYRYVVGSDANGHAVLVVGDQAGSGHGVALTRIDGDSLRLDRSFGRGGRALVELRGLQRLRDAAVLPDGSTLLLAQRPTWVRRAGAEATLTRVVGGADRTEPRVSLTASRCVRGHRLVRVRVRDGSVLSTVVARRDGHVIRRTKRARLTLRVRAEHRVRVAVTATDAAGNTGLARRFLRRCH